MSRRREPRVEIDLDVKVWGLDRYGKPFVQHARTVDATRAGIRLAGVDCVNVGEVLGIQHGEHRAHYSVIWMGRENTPKAGQIGLHCLEPGKAILQARPRQVDEAATRRFGFEPVKKPVRARRDMSSARRKHPRYPCSGGVELRQQESGAPAWGNLSDISLTGCYVETATSLPVGSMVLFRIRTHDLDISGRAFVKTSNHAVGVGLAFLHLAADDQHSLEFLIGSLAGQQEMLPEEQRTFVPADYPMEVQVNPKSEEPPPAEPSNEGGISGQIMRAITDLSELEQYLVKDKVDPRLIAQFHDAMEHTRQTAWTVQQYVDLRTGGGDPFGVLPQLEAERMHMLMKLAHNVLADLDAGSINEFSEGIAELYELAQQLHKRLLRMFQPNAGDEGERTFKSSF